MMFIGKHLLPKRTISEDTEVEQEIEANETSSTKMAVSGIILLAVVLTMALGIKGVTLEMAAITGAIVSVLTGCLTEKQAYASIDWVTIFLFAGMMPVSSAMSKTGAGKVIAEWAVGLMGGSPSPMIVTAVLFILSCGLTQFMSNTASAALLCPIGIAISKQLGADPAAVLMAIAEIHGLRKSRYRSGNRLLRNLPDFDSYVLAFLPRLIIQIEDIYKVA